MPSNICSINRGSSDTSGTFVTFIEAHGHDDADLGNQCGWLVDISTIDALSPPPRRARTSALALARAAAGALGLVAVLAVGACGGGSDGDASDPLPDVALTDLQTGEPADWDAQGKPMVVNMWASWCAPCRTEMPDFEEVHQELGDQVAIVGVTDERTLDAATEAADAAGVTYPLLVDEDQRLLIDLGITGMPGTVFVDADGQVVETHTGALTKDELLAQIEETHGITA